MATWTDVNPYATGPTLELDSLAIFCNDDPGDCPKGMAGTATWDRDLLAASLMAGMGAVGMVRADAGIGGRAPDLGSREQANAETDLAQLACGDSFSAATRVLLADGKTKPIGQLTIADRVLATNVTTGKTQSEPVAAVLVRHDRDLYDLKVKSRSGMAIIHTTRDHLFWDRYLKRWVPAAKLKVGEPLKTASGQTATADGGTVPQDHTGWMWDLTVPGDDDHDFYVLPAQPAGSGDAYHVAAVGMVPILVHNCGNSFTKVYPGGSTVLAEVDGHGAMTMAIDAAEGSTSGGQMFQDAMEALGPENVRSFQAKWVRAMPSNLNAFNANLRAGMSYEEAAANTFTGHMLAKYGLTEVAVNPGDLVGEFGNYTNVQLAFSRPIG